MPDQFIEFLSGIVMPIVEFKDEVKITRRNDDMGVLLTLSLNNADMGKIIGRAGSTAQAIRTLLRVIGAKNGARVTLKIDEPAGGKFREQTS